MPYADLTHKHLDDHSLQRALQALPPSTTFVDLRFNRLGLRGLRLLVSYFLMHGTQMSACVGENNFHFEPFFKVLTEMSVDSWIEADRLNMGFSDQHRHLDKLAADLLRRDISLAELGKQVFIAQQTNTETAHLLATSVAQQRKTDEQQTRNAGSIANLIGYNQIAATLKTEQCRSTECMVFSVTA